MKIIYDSEKKGFERCVVEMDDGLTQIVGCYDIKVETTNLNHGTPYLLTECKRWGNQKVREKKHKAIKEAFDKEQEKTK